MRDKYPNFTALFSSILFILFYNFFRRIIIDFEISTLACYLTYSQVDLEEHLSDLARCNHLLSHVSDQLGQVRGEVRDTLSNKALPLHERVCLSVCLSVEYSRNFKFHQIVIIVMMGKNASCKITLPKLCSYNSMVSSHSSGSSSECVLC